MTSLPDPASTPERGLVIALLGAESTGKTTLAFALREALAAEGRDCAVVPEYLREFCERERRTPHRDEQAAIATEQSRRIEAAAGGHALVIADTTALMIAVYSEQVFGETSLYADAGRSHASACDLTLLTALDLPWRADGLQRDGPHVREPVDAKVRAALDRASVPYAVVFGTGDERLAAALAVVQRVIGAREAGAGPGTANPARGEPRWHWHCERCGDTDCERRRFLPGD